jgi:hypothetical protein
LPKAAIGLRPMNFWMPTGLPAFVDKINFRKTQQHRVTISYFKSGFNGAAHHQIVEDVNKRIEQLRAIQNSAGH